MVRVAYLMSNVCYSETRIALRNRDNIARSSEAALFHNASPNYSPLKETAHRTVSLAVSGYPCWKPRAMVSKTQILQEKPTKNTKENFSKTIMSENSIMTLKSALKNRTKLLVHFTQPPLYVP